MQTAQEAIKNRGSTLIYHSNEIRSRMHFHGAPLLGLTAIGPYSLKICIHYSFRSQRYEVALILPFIRYNVKLSVRILFRIANYKVL